MTAADEGAAASPPSPPAPGRLRHALFALALAAAVAHLVVIAFQHDESCDLPWHLALGDELFETGRIPTHDRYSYAFAGRPYTAVPWLGDAALAASYRLAGGLAGPMVLRLACLLGAFLLFLRLLRAWGVGRLLAVAMLALAFELARGRMQLRPEMFLPLFLAAVMWLLHWHEAHASRLALAAVVPLVALFANVHQAASAFLLVLVCAYAGWRVAGLAARGRLPTLVGPPVARVDAAWCVTVAALAGGAMLLNPTFMDPFRFVRLSTPLMLDSIVEYARIPLLDRPSSWQAFVALTAVALPLGWHRRSLYGAAVVLVLGVAAFRWARMSGPFVIGATPFVAAAVAVALERARARIPAGRRRRWSGVGAVGLAGLVGLAAWEAYATEGVHRSVAVAMSPAVYPIGATEFLRANPSTGRLYNDYGLGGYLLWRLGPATKVLIDGRAPITYDGAFYETVSRSARDPAAFAALCQRYGITRAVRRTRTPSFHLTELAGWRVVYFDDVALVYAADVPAERAVRERHAYRHLDPLRAEGLLLLAADPARAPVVAEAERALAAQPGSVLAHRVRAVLAAADGDAARLAVELAFLARAGVAVDRTTLGMGLLVGQGRSRAALAALDAARRDGGFERLLRARALMLAGDRPAARPLLASMEHLPEALLWLGDAARADGDDAAARALHERYVRQVGGDPLHASRVARVRRALATTLPASAAGTQPAGAAATETP